MTVKTDFQQGREAGEKSARELDPEFVRHNSEHPVGRYSNLYRAGYRLGFANVRNEIVTGRSGPV